MSQNYSYPSSSDVTITGIGDPTGQPIPANAVYVAGENPSGDLEGLKTDANGNLLVSLSDSVAEQDVNLNQVSGASITLGLKAAAASLPVILASDQTLPLPSGASTSSLQTSGNVSLSSIDSKLGTLGQKAAAGSAPVVLASDQTLPLPSGAATSALQTSGNTSLSSIDSKTPALGQALAAASVPVVLTSAQLAALTPLTSTSVTLLAGSAIAGKFGIDQTTPGTTNAVQVTGTVPLPTGAATETTLAAMSAKLPATLGAKTTANSMAVNVASDQTLKAASATPAALTITQAAVTVGTSAVRLTVSGSAPSATRVVLVVTPDAASAAKFYIGSATVTSTSTTRGIQIVASQSFIANNDAGDYYIVSDTAAQTVEIMEQA